jgi:putative flippase GtrA
MNLPSGLAARVHQLVRYCAVSVISTTTSLVILTALVSTATVSAGWANVVATAVGTVPSFELNRRWVWGKQGRRSLSGEIGPFCVLSFSGLALSTLAVSMTGRWATDVGLSIGARSALVDLANLSAFGLVWIVQFLVLDRILFGGRRAPAELAPATWH